MAVYVDYLFPAAWRYKKACHMTADTLEELHEMAVRMHLKRWWFQEHPRYPHYDLTAGKRALALQFGAIEQRRPVSAKKGD
ncbi:MAG: DUF4031 domain-containing protein [Planctomycetota bacterium]|jgi:hypothetical protein